MEYRCMRLGAELGESPLWIPERQCFVWLDLPARQVYLLDPASGEDRLIASDFAEQLACVARLAGGEDVLLVTASRFLRQPLDGGPPEALPTAVRLAPGTCFNDGKVDPHGCLWIGSSDLAEQAPLGALWRIWPDGRLDEVDRGFVVSNGPAFAPDGRTVYFADTFGGRLLAYELDAAGEVRERRTLVHLPAEKGYPDGLTVDRDGRLFSAHWAGGGLTRYDPDGVARGFIALDTANITACAFGGEEYSLLLVTSARGEGADADVHGGSLYLLAGQGVGVAEPVLSLTGVLTAAAGGAAAGAVSVLGPWGGKF